MIFGNEDEHVVTDAQIVQMLEAADRIAMGRDEGALNLEKQQSLIRALGVDPEAFFERAEKERKG